MTDRRVAVDGGELAVVDEGRGEAVLFVNGGLVADPFAPLCAQPSVARGRRFLRMHRRGYGHSTLPASGSVTQDAVDCARVLDMLGVERAHVVGWSYGGAVALQLAMDRPALIGTVVVLEPALLTVPAAADLAALLGLAVEAWVAGDVRRALDEFHAPIWGPDWRRRLESAIPGGVAQAETDAGSLFDADLPALSVWAAGAEAVRTVTAPVLQVTGGASGLLMEQIREQVTSWLPQTENVTIPGGDHSFPITRAADLAGPLSGFLDRHVWAPQPA